MLLQRAKNKQLKISAFKFIAGGSLLKYPTTEFNILKTDII